ncbi:hypothetical protein PR048_032643 [Dryococelus australis]|uniref:Uncharacterized protein n=1 Tax=Dryococelus australis TaxID=614101 RepID=A0ABQ9G2S6_9NEOP|nr:hypothetical protein PR048_032643 [Dryococelus australis]
MPQKLLIREMPKRRNIGKLRILYIHCACGYSLNVVLSVCLELRRGLQKQREDAFCRAASHGARYPCLLRFLRRANYSRALSSLPLSLTTPDVDWSSCEAAHHPRHLPARISPSELPPRSRQLRAANAKPDPSLWRLPIRSKLPQGTVYTLLRSGIKLQTVLGKGIALHAFKIKNVAPFQEKNHTTGEQVEDRFEWSHSWEESFLGEESVVGVVSFGRSQFREESVLGGVSFGRSQFWEESLLGEVILGRSHSWKESFLGGNSLGRSQSCEDSVLVGFEIAINAYAYGFLANKTCISAVTNGKRSGIRVSDCSRSHPGEPGSVRSHSDIRMWELCQTIPLIGGFSLGSSVYTTLAFRHCSVPTSVHPYRYWLPRPRSVELQTAKSAPNVHLVPVCPLQHATSSSGTDCICLESCSTHWRSTAISGTMALRCPTQVIVQWIEIQGSTRVTFDDEPADNSGMGQVLYTPRLLPLYLGPLCISVDGGLCSNRSTGVEWVSRPGSRCLQEGCVDHVRRKAGGRLPPPPLSGGVLGFDVTGSLAGSRDPPAARVRRRFLASWGETNSPVTRACRVLRPRTDRVCFKKCEETTNRLYFKYFTLKGDVVRERCCVSSLSLPHYCGERLYVNGSLGLLNIHDDNNSQGVQVSMRMDVFIPAILLVLHRAPVVYIAALPSKRARSEETFLRVPRVAFTRPPAKIYPGERRLGNEYGAASELKGEGNGRSPRKLADQRHHLAQFRHAKIRSGPARDRTRIALVGEQANRSATGSLAQGRGASDSDLGEPPSRDTTRPPSWMSLTFHPRPV